MKNGQEKCTRHQKGGGLEESSHFSVPKILLNRSKWINRD